MNIGMAYFEFGGPKGISRTVAELSLGLARRGQDVCVHCTSFPHTSPHPKIRFQRVVALNAFNSVGLLSFAVAGGRSLRRFSYDITHTHGNIIGSDIITAHGCHKAALEVSKRFRKTSHERNLGIADAIRLHIERANYVERRFKKVVAVSVGVKRELMQTYGLGDNDIRVIPSGVDVESFHPRHRDTAGRQVRSRLGISPEDVVLIFVANEYERKGLAEVIDALSLLRGYPVKLLVVGNDRQEPYRARAAARGVSDRIMFCVLVPEIEHYYAAADVFILPTYYEAFSLATFEAAASGLPILVTGVNGPDEFIRNGENGFFIERDADDIAKKVRLLVEDGSLRRTLGARAREGSLRYSWDAIAEQTLRLYEEVR